AHSSDGEVMYSLGIFLGKLGRHEEAKKLFDEAANLGYRSVAMMIDAADRLHAEGNLDTTLISLKEALNDSRATYLELNRAVRLAAHLDISLLKDFMSSPRFRALQPKTQASLCDQLFVSRDALPLIERTIRSLGSGHIIRDLRPALM